MGMTRWPSWDLWCQLRRLGACPSSSRVASQAMNKDDTALYQWAMNGMGSYTNSAIASAGS